MAFSRNKPVVGVDIGNAEVKAVALGVRGKRIAVLGMQTLDTREEGIIDDAELRGTVAEWLSQIGWINRELSHGIPQYLTTTQVSDFPPGATTGLDEMVAYETRQLAGLSEEGFMHDYQVMEPFFGRKNPALIGICRESVVRDRTEALGLAGIPLVELSMNGLAVANAFFDLHPEALNIRDPQLLLDMGAESSSVIVVAAGQVLFVGSLLFGADKVTQALAKHLGIREEEAEKVKRTARLNPADTLSPLYQTAQQLENELRTSVEHWRAQERQEIAGKMFAQIWLSGGGAQLAGLDDYLSRTYGCEAKVFGPVDRETKTVMPTLVTAYGLALQGLGRAHISVSLCPPEIRWTRIRRKRFGYLISTTLVVAVALTCLLLNYYRRLEAEKAHIAARMAEIDKCSGLIPQLEKTTSAIRHYERMLIPFAEKGNRARRFLNAIDELREARASEDWFVYLADEASYQAKRNVEKSPGSEAPEGRTEKRPAPSLFRAPTPTEESAGTDSEFAKLVPVREIDQMETLIVGVFTPYQRGNRYGPVREVVRKLNRKDPAGKKLNTPGLFDGVDLLPEDDRVGREDIFREWTELFEENPGKKFMDYTLRLPFEKLDVDLAITDEKEAEGTAK